MAIVSLYKVQWRNSGDRHKTDSPERTDLVVAAPGTSGVALGALIQASLTDGASVTVSNAQVVQTGILQ